MFDRTAGYLITTASSQNFSNPSEIDVTDPNNHSKSLRPTHFDRYYYQEKKIIDLLQKETISEEEYQLLYLLVQVPIPEEHCIAKNCWGRVMALTNYEAFKTEERALKDALSERYAFIKQNAAFVYKTSAHTRVYLLESDSEKLDSQIKILLKEMIKEGCFDVSVLGQLEARIKEDMQVFAKQALNADKDQWNVEYLFPHSLQVVVDEEAHKAFLKCKKMLQIDLPQLIQSIVKMRFLVELDEQTVSLKLKRALDYNLYTTYVKLKGFSIPERIMTAQEIQATLNNLLFYESSIDEVKMLIKMGADPNGIDREKRTILNFSLSLEQTEKALLLLELGADPNITSTSLTGNSDLMVAILNKLSPEIIFILIKKTKDLDFKNNLSETALMMAINTNSPYSVIVKLIELTKTINAKSNQGYRALDFAISISPRTQCSETIKKLILQGASTSIPNEDGNLPLMHAAFCCNPAAVKFIFKEAPEFINTANKQGDTALLLVFKNSNHSKEAGEIIDFLIKKGANPYVINKNGEDAFLVAKKQEQLISHLETAMKTLEDKILSRKMLVAFVKSLLQTINNKQHRLASPANILMTLYLNYLDGLGGNNTPKSTASLIAQISFLQKQKDFSVSFMNKIINDIRMHKGQGHKALLTDDPDLIDRFLRIKMDVPRLPQKLPNSIKTGRSFIDNRLVNYGESAYLFNKLDDFLKQETLELGEDFSFILSDPRFWALPKETLKLMYDNQAVCKHLIKNWGLSYGDFRELSQKKLNILSLADKFIEEFKVRNISLSEMIRFNEGCLEIVLKNPTGLYALLDEQISLKRLRKIEINQLTLLLENARAVSFFFRHTLNLGQILALNVPTFNLLSSQLERLTTLIDSNVSLDSIVGLDYNELAILLIGNKTEQEAIQTSLGV